MVTVLQPCYNTVVMEDVITGQTTNISILFVPVKTDTTGGGDTHVLRRGGEVVTLLCVAPASFIQQMTDAMKKFIMKQRFLFLMMMVNEEW